MIRYLFAWGMGLFVWWCTQVLVSPMFWASIPIGNKYIGILKVGAALATVAVLLAVTRRSKAHP